MFGPDLPPPKLKELKPKQKTMSKKAIERRIKKRQERRIQEAERLQEQQRRRDAKIAAKREEEMKRRAEGVMKVKAKRDPKRHHGTEEVDSTILKLLGKSHKKQVARKGKQSVVRPKKVDAQQGAKWKPGMREVVGERMQQRLQQRRRLIKKAEAERSSRKETKVVNGGILSDLLSNLPVSFEEKASTHPSTPNPFHPEQKSSKTSSPTFHPEVKPISPPSPSSISIPSDVHGLSNTSSPTFHPEVKHVNPPSPSSIPSDVHPEIKHINQPSPSSISILSDVHVMSKTSFHPEFKPINPPSPSSISIPSDGELTESSSSEAEDELSSDYQEEKHLAKKRNVKRKIKQTNTSAESSDEEEEKPIHQRRRKGFLRQVNPAPSLTESSGAETPHLEDDDEEQSRTTHVYGELKGGAGTYEENLSMAELMIMAIQKAQLQLKLDADTPGLGNCFSIAMLQQFQRPQVKLFLQSRGMKITSFMQLKKEVVQFVRTHMHTEKMKNLKENFELSQRNIAKENPHLKPRTWSKYWKDMLIDGEWADDTFIQAFAWYANMHIIIVIAGQANSEEPFYTMEGTFSSETTGPTLLVGYINGNHYQSLLPLQEDRSRPEYLAQPAIDETLRDTLQKLGFEIAKLKQGGQVGS